MTTPCVRTIAGYYPFAFLTRMYMDSLLLGLRLVTRIASGGRVSDGNVISRYQKLVYSKSESWSVLPLGISNAGE